MRQLLPVPVDDVDPIPLYEVARPSPSERPSVVINMVSSVDGGTTAERGVSGGLGGPGDHRVFGVLRSLADVILVGAQTVRAEGYGPARPDDATRARRLARGQTDTPDIAIVSLSLGLDWASPFFTEAARRPLVITPTAAGDDALARAATAAEVIVAGDEAVDVAVALRALRERGARLVLCEGGPTLNAGLLQAGVVDELCLTLSPALVGVGGGNRISGGALLEGPRHLTLAHALEEGGFLFLRYLLGPVSPEGER